MHFMREFINSDFITKVFTLCFYAIFFIHSSYKTNNDLTKQNIPNNQGILKIVPIQVISQWYWNHRNFHIYQYPGVVQRKASQKPKFKVDPSYPQKY